MSVLDDAVSEADFSDQIIDTAARLYRWYAYRTHDSRKSPAGYPDLSMVRGDRHVYVELKVKKRELTPEQRAWLVALYEAGHEVFVWRWPAEWNQAVDVLSGAYRGLMA